MVRHEPRLARRGGCPGSVLASGLLWLLATGVAAAAAEPAPRPGITAITLERGCFGCPRGSVLSLHRDGTVRYTLTGSARHGTADTSSTSTLSAEDFDSIARLAEREGFFDLNDSYDNPALRDGPWTTTSVERGGRDTRVFSRDDAAPPGLKALNAAIDGLRARLRFVPER